MTRPLPGPVEQRRADVLADRLDALSARLTRLADTATATAKDVRAGYPESRRSTPYADFAGAIIHEITVELMNAVLSGIVIAAAEAEVARAQENP